MLKKWTLDFLGDRFISKLEKALRAFASSSGGAACPGVNPRGRPQELGGDSKAI